MMGEKYQCPQCDNVVEINILKSAMSFRRLLDKNPPSPVEAWCATRHLKPVRMELTEQGESNAKER